MLISKTPIVFAANPSTGLKTLADLIARARANPGKLNYGSPGHGTAAHITAELLQSDRRLQDHACAVSRLGTDDRRSAGQPDRPRRRSVPDADTAAQGRQVCRLALTSLTRSAALPDLPTVAESGFAGFEAASWNSLLAPTGAPAEAIAKLNAIVNAYLKSERGKQDLAKFEMQAGGGTPDDLKAFMANEAAKWGPIIKAANITIE